MLLNTRNTACEVSRKMLGSRNPEQLLFLLLFPPELNVDGDFHATKESVMAGLVLWQWCFECNGQRHWSVGCIAQREALVCIHPKSPLPCYLAAAVELWLNSSSALAPRGVDWFVFPSVTLRKPEKLKCESFMLHERRGQQASQLGKKQQACFISEADGQSFRATLSAEDFVLQTMGLFRKGREDANMIFQSATKAFQGSRWTLERSFHSGLLTVCTQGLA